MSNLEKIKAAMKAANKQEVDRLKTILTKEEKKALHTWLKSKPWEAKVEPKEETKVEPKEETKVEEYRQEVLKAYREKEFRAIDLDPQGNGGNLGKLAKGKGSKQMVERLYANLLKLRILKKVEKFNLKQLKSLEQFVKALDTIKPIEEKPIEEKPIEEKPIEEKPIEEKPIEEEPIEEKPIEEEPIKEEPIEEKPIEEKPIEEKPIEEKPIEEKPIEEEVTIRKNMSIIINNITDIAKLENILNKAIEIEKEGEIDKPKNK